LYEENRKENKRKIENEQWFYWINLMTEGFTGKREGKDQIA
jgi:hypothetical protein